jgi:hypothetical protein
MILGDHRAASYRKENATRMHSVENIQGGEFGGGGTKEEERTTSYLSLISPANCKESKLLFF